jgi:hypothetical protein
MLRIRVTAVAAVIAETEAGSSLDSPAGIHLHELDALPGSADLRRHRLDKLVQIIDDRGTVILRSATLEHAGLAPPSLVGARGAENRHRNDDLARWRN